MAFFIDESAIIKRFFAHTIRSVCNERSLTKPSPREGCFIVTILIWEGCVYNVICVFLI